MRKRVRIVLFLICLILFFLSAPLAIFYSQGYRIDFDSKKITQTGGLFLKVIPKQAEIYLDGKLVKKTDFFFGSALIENLLPRKYKVTVKKEGYFSWEKNLKIEERKVTEAKNIILFPKNLKFLVLDQEVKNFWFSPDRKKIIIKEAVSLPSEKKESWALKLYHLDKNLKSHLISENDIFPGKTDLLNLKFSPSSKEIYLDVAFKEKERSFVLNLEKVPPVLIERETATSSKDIVASSTFGGNFYYLDKQGWLYKNGEKLNEKPFPIKSETKYILWGFGNFIFLKEGKTLYLFSSNSRSFEKFFPEINDLKISPDLKKLAYFSNHEIWIFYLKEVPGKKVGQKVFLLRTSEKIEELFWLNSNYLIFTTKEKIKVTEIDERDKINIVDLGKFKEPKIFFNQKDKKLYLLSQKILYQSEPLIK